MFNGLLFILLLALGLPLVGRGQSLPSGRGAVPDSATAIKRLFRQRRLYAANMGLAVGCGSVAPGASAMPTPCTNSQMLLPPASTAGLGTDRSLLSMFSGMRFSPKREQQVLLLLARHRPLPGYVQRALGSVFASAN